MKPSSTFTHKKLLAIIKEEFQIDFYGDHGIAHWQRVFKNTQILAQYYNVQSDVFELFSILHDSQRVDEYTDIEHGLRASWYAKELIVTGVIKLDVADQERLIYACANHTATDTEHRLYNDLVVQICFDSDRLDIGRVGIHPHKSYMATEYAKKLTV